MQEETKKEFTLLVGISGSGKSTWVEQQDLSDTVVISRDKLRQELYNAQGKTVLFPFQEKYITLAERRMALKAMLQGKNIIIDDTNLQFRFICDWLNFVYSAAIAYSKKLPCLYTFATRIFTDSLDVEKCVKRDLARKTSVGAAVITRQAKQFKKVSEQIKELEKDPLQFAHTDFNLPKVTSFDVEKYVLNTKLPPCYIFDIDGTVAQAVDRDIYNNEDVSGDAPIWSVLGVARALRRDGYEIVFVSGRKNICREQTVQWLNKYFFGLSYQLFMRNTGDDRSDDIVKYEIFNNELRNNYCVCGWFDDRHRVSALIQELGVKLFFVGQIDNNF